MNIENQGEHDFFDQANNAWDMGDEVRAFELFMNAAQLGDIYAFNSIGYFYDEGLGIPVNKQQALKWYKKAAAYGDVPACINLGVFYKEAGNIRQAKFWFRRAITLGDDSGVLHLAKILCSQHSKKSTRYIQELLNKIISSDDICEDDKKEAHQLLKTLSLVN